MEHTDQFYIGGKWVDPVSRNTLDVVDPSNEEVIATIAIGDADDVDAAVAAARDAFESYSLTTREERLELFDCIIEAYKARWAELGDVIVSVEGAEIHRSADLFKALDAHKVGDVVDVVVDNAGQRRTVKVTLQALP